MNSVFERQVTTRVSKNHLFNQLFNHCSLEERYLLWSKIVSLLYLREDGVSPNTTPIHNTSEHSRGTPLASSVGTKDIFLRDSLRQPECVCESHKSVFVSLLRQNYGVIFSRHAKMDFGHSSWTQLFGFRYPDISTFNKTCFIAMLTNCKKSCVNPPNQLKIHFTEVISFRSKFLQRKCPDLLEVRSNSRTF